jgi:hypothetical protein
MTVRWLAFVISASLYLRIIALFLALIILGACSPRRNRQWLQLSTMMN